MKYTADTLTNLTFTNFLIIGPYKTGKTQSLATLRKLKNRPFIQGKKLYVYDFDEGSQPLIRLAKRDGWLSELVIYRYGQLEKVERDTGAHTSKDPFLDFLTDLNSLFDHLTPQNQWREDFLTEAPYAMATDSLTIFQDVVQNYILAANNKIRTAEMDGDTGTMYRKIREKILETIRSQKSLPCFSVWLAHEQAKVETVKQPWTPKGATAPPIITTGGYRILPVVAGQLASTLGAEFGGVFYSRSKRETSTSSRYYWITAATDNIPGAGSRLKQNLQPEIDQDFSLVVE